MIDEGKNGLVGGLLHEMSGFVRDSISVPWLNYVICPVRSCGFSNYFSRREIVVRQNVLSHALVFWSVPWTVRSTAVCGEGLAGINGWGGLQERLFRT